MHFLREIPQIEVFRTDTYIYLKEERHNIFSMSMFTKQIFHLHDTHLVHFVNTCRQRKMPGGKTSSTPCEGNMVMSDPGFVFVGRNVGNSWKVVIRC